MNGQYPNNQSGQNPQQPENPNQYQPYQQQAPQYQQPAQPQYQQPDPNQYQAPQPQYQQPQQPAGQYQPTYQPQPQYQQPVSANASAAVKKPVPWKLVGVIGAAVLLLIIIVSIISACAGGGETSPVNRVVDLYNKKSVTVDQYIDATTCGLLSGELKDFMRVFAKTSEGEDLYESFPENWEDRYEYSVDEYGSNFRISFKLEDKDELDKKELREYRDNIRAVADKYSSAVSNYKDLKSTEKGDLADELDISTGDLNKMMDALGKITDTLKHADVDAGYLLGGYTVITGSELDEPEEERTTYTVLKVNGVWVEYETFRSVVATLDVSDLT